MPGRVYAALFETAVEQYGYITAKDARELGFGPGHLVDLARRDDLDRVAHGLYRFKAVPVTIRDQLMEAALWPRGLGVISHATALDLWDLCGHLFDQAVDTAIRQGLLTAAEQTEITAARTDRVDTP